jgi:hypothetical protein
MADAAAGAVVAGGGAVVVGLRVTMAGLLPHPAARATSPAAAAQRRPKSTILTYSAIRDTPGRALARQFTFAGQVLGQ